MSRRIILGFRGPPAFVATMAARYAPLTRSNTIPRVQALSIMPRLSPGEIGAIRGVIFYHPNTEVAHGDHE